MPTEKVIIIGSGPAALTAAIYTARARLNPLVIEGYAAGGQLMITSDVENFPGFPEAVTGPELVEKCRKQAERFGTRFETVDVTKVDFSKRPFKITTDVSEHFAETVIISTGANAKLLGIPSEQTFMGFGVSACATCDGAFYKDKKLFIVGGGDTCMEEAMFLTRFASEVTVVHRRDSLRASKIMQEKAQANPKIKWMWNSEIVEILGQEKPRKFVTSAKVKNLLTSEEKSLPIDGVFVAIGHQPNSSLFKEYLDLDAVGYIKTIPGKAATKIPGVFAAGDVQDHEYRQAITAAGSGCMAALEAERFLAH